MMDAVLEHLASLIRIRNALEVEITQLIGRPAQIGHLGEFIASQIFNIELEESASRKGIDGRFLSGSLACKTVNVKWSATQNGLLNMTPDDLPDYYLVMTGPKTGAVSSRGVSRPWVIEYVFLFDAPVLVEQIRRIGSKIGVATSIPQKYWKAAELFPENANREMQLTEDQILKLKAFSGRQG